MPIRSKQELKFYILADRMMNKRTFKYSLGQKVKNIFHRGCWYDSPSFQERVDKIEALRREM